MSAVALKLLACALMVADHVGYLEGIPALRAVGRLSMPLFCLLLAVGYEKTRSFGRYALRLGLSALLSEALYDLCFFGTAWNPAYQSVMVTLLLGLLALRTEEWLRGRLWRGLVLGAICLTAELVGADYGAFGVLLIWGLHRAYVRGGGAVRYGAALCAPVGLTLLCWFLGWGVRRLTGISLNTLPLAGGLFPEYITEWMLVKWLEILALPLLCAYNGASGMPRQSRGGRLARLGFYLFYPLHLLALTLWYRL